MSVNCIHYLVEELLKQHELCISQSNARDTTHQPKDSPPLPGGLASLDLPPEL